MDNDIIEPSFQRTDERGTFIEVLNGGHWESLIRGRMRAGAVLGHHYHRKTTVFFFLQEGAAKIEIIHVETGRQKRVWLKSNNGIVLHTNESHAIRFLEESDFLMLKSMTYDPADPDTVPYPVPESD
jgi:dTDP-4-dehydrorhamnose 3,5-epimerase-like enzyme